MQVFGDYSNLLKRTSIVYNVEVRRLKTAIQYFSSFGTPDHKSLKQST